MIVKEPGHTGKVRVTFSMPAGIWADSIHLVGDFNGWNPTATPLRLNDYNWSVSLDLDNGHAYQYRYLVNGTDWYNDWRADDYRPNELGGDNSVVVAATQHEVLEDLPHLTIRRTRDPERAGVLTMRSPVSEADLELRREIA
jgi:1,4-alpha-glucan branching enzyme